MVESELNEYTRSSSSEPEARLNVLDHFGIFPEIPTLSVLKLCSVVLLVILVELNTIVNLSTLHPGLVEMLGNNINALLGISLIGLFIGLLFRYMDFEFKQLKALPKDNKTRNTRFKTYLTLFFLLAIGIFIVLEVIVELIFARGVIALIDLLNIFIVIVGTYAIFAGNRNLIVASIPLIFILMMLGIDSGTGLPMMVLLGSVTLLYIEVSDGTIRLQENVIRFYDMMDQYESDNRYRANIETQMDNMSIRFIKTLSLFFILTLIITSLLLLVYTSYLSITPAFINENLELQTVYAILPSIILLFLIFLSYHILTRYLKPLTQKKS